MIPMKQDDDLEYFPRSILIARVLVSAYLIHILRVLESLGSIQNWLFNDKETKQNDILSKPNAV